jgi:restriction endonuclease S subunit
MLTGQYLELANKLDDLDLDSQVIADTIESTGIVDDIVIKAQNIELVARSFESQLGAIDDEIERLKALKKAREAKAEGLREYLKNQLEMMEIKQVTCERFNISIVKNPPSAEILDEALIDSKFFVQPPPPPPKLDKKALSAALKAGEKIEGALLVQKTRLKVA